MSELFSTFTDRILAVFPNVLTAILIFAVSYYTGVWLSRLLRRMLQRQKAEAGISHLLSQILKWAVISLGFITALQRFFDVTAFLTGLGIIGFTIGFALQNIMQNFISGVILLVQQPFKVDDEVNLSGYEGVVQKIGLRTTEVRLRNGLLTFLPNADVLAQPIINYTRAAGFRVELPASVSYDADLEVVRSIILNEIKNVSGVLDSPSAQVLFHTFGASSIDLTVQFWIKNASDQHSAKDTALTRIKQAFERHKIEIPYPIQIVRPPARRPARNKK